MPLVELLIIITFKQVLGWHHMRPFMAGNVDLQFIGMVWVRGNF